MEIIKLTKDAKTERNKVVDNISKNKIFILDNDSPLHEYINNLELNGNHQLKLKICKELHNLNVSLQKNIGSTHLNTLSAILEKIEDNDKAIIVIHGDLNADEEKQKQIRIQLGNIIQQLIYINIPLSDIQVMTEKEWHDIEKIQSFEKKINQHYDTICETCKRLESISNDTDNYKSKISESANCIKNYLSQAKDNELKIAAAASKKTGKSVVVNSIIGKELAPTSLETATPNNCIYKPSNSDKYTLDYNGEHHEYTNPADLHKYIGEQFKKAAEDYEHGKGIPDMKIGYVTNKEGLSQYTIYDTPGPDRAGANAHKEAANRAIREADVIIFSIDYSKHLTDTEKDYLEQIKNIFNENQKSYSLILNINKMDLRYDTSDNKSTVRIMDFIREELIKLSPEFDGAVITGTSALTYFNCLAAPELEKCEKLASSQNLEDDIKSCKKLYTDKSEMSILSQIGRMISNAEDFHSIKIESLDEMKQFSGMPNLLSYIKYIATTKARNEKVNNLIFKIDSEYKKIMNYFHFADLEKALSENQEKLNKSTEALKEFQFEISEIFDDNYHDLQEIVEADEKLPDESDKKCRSRIIRELANQKNIKFDDIYTKFKKKVDSAFNICTLSENIVNGQIIFYISKNIDKIFSDKSKIKKRKNPTTKKEENVANIDDIKSIYRNITSEYFIGDLVKGYIDEKCKVLSEQFSSEYKNISDDFENILNCRLEAMKKAVDKCKNTLKAECDISFDLEVPEFKFQFENITVKNANENKYLAGLNLKENLQNIYDYTMGAKGENNIPQYIKNLLKGNFSLITKEDAKSIYTECNFPASIRGVLEESKELKMVVNGLQDRLNHQVESFFNQLKPDIESVQNNANDIANNIKNILDPTDECIKTKEQLESKTAVLHNLEECIRPFKISWRGE